MNFVGKHSWELVFSCSYFYLMLIKWPSFDMIYYMGPYQFSLGVSYFIDRGLIEHRSLIWYCNLLVPLPCVNTLLCVIYDAGKILVWALVLGYKTLILDNLYYEQVLVWHSHIFLYLCYFIKPIPVYGASH